MQKDFEVSTDSSSPQIPRERRATDASATMLRDVRCPKLLYGLPASQGLTRLLTLAGRLPYKIGAASLTAWELEVLQSTFGDDECLFQPVEDLDPVSRERNIIITHSQLGKLSLYPATEPLSLDDTLSESVLGGFSLRQAQLEAIAEKCLEEQALEDAELRNLEQLLVCFEAEGVLEEKVAQVMDWVEHVESVYIYIDRHVFSRSDVGNTLLRSNGILAAIRSRPLVEWSSQERLFVAAVHVLFLTGRSIRLEEFNGQRLSAMRLREWIWRKCCVYHTALEREMPVALLSLPLYKLAERVGQLAFEVDATDWIRIRRLNGLNMLKTEHLLPHVRSKMIPQELPPLLHLFATRLLQAEPGAGWTPEETISQATRYLLECYSLEQTTELLSQFVERMVLSAVLESGADYGMSSSLRNPWRLQGEADERAAGALSLAKNEFFCCVIPHPHFAQNGAREIVFEALHASAMRMEFNRWHFIAGNFPREEIPLKRHYYFPPMMPDIAEWSDLRHSGHTAAGVRYTIRVPGPSLWTPPFLSFGHGYRGCYDVRLVRIQGPAFSNHELWIAARHGALMSAFWRTIQAFVERTDYAVPLFTRFTRQYYLDEEWRDCLRDVVLLKNKEKGIR